MCSTITTIWKMSIIDHIFHMYNLSIHPSTYLSIHLCIYVCTHTHMPLSAFLITEFLQAAASVML